MAEQTTQTADQTVDQILQALDRGASDYEVLGLPPNSNPDAVKAAFVQLARRIHPDLPAFKTPEAKEKATRAFQGLTKAQLVLTDPTRREEQLTQAADAEAKSDEPNPELARIHLHRGRQCASKRDWVSAEMNFSRAVMLFGEKSNDFARVELGWAIFNNSGRDELSRADESQALFEAVIEDRGDPGAVAHAHYCMAVWCKMNDEVPEVKRHLQRCLSINDKHVEARRELRLFERRRSSSSHKRVTGTHKRPGTERRSRVTAKMPAAAPDTPTGGSVTREIKKVPLQRKPSLLERLFGKSK